MHIGLAGSGATIKGLCQSRASPLGAAPHVTRGQRGRQGNQAHARRAQEERLRMDELRLAPGALAELLALVEAGTISGKIGKQLLPALFQARARACSGP